MTEEKMIEAVNYLRDIALGGIDYIHRADYAERVIEVRESINQAAQSAVRIAKELEDKNNGITDERVLALAQSYRGAKWQFLKEETKAKRLENARNLLRMYPSFRVSNQLSGEGFVTPREYTIKITREELEDMLRQAKFDYTFKIPSCPV